MDHNNGSLVKQPSLFPTLPAAAPVPSLTSHSRFRKLLDLVRDAVELDLKLKDCLSELQREAQEIGYKDLPSVFMSLVQHGAPGLEPQPRADRPKKPTAAQAAPLHHTRGGVLRAEVLGVLSDAKEHKVSQVNKELEKYSPNSIQTVLSQLYIEGLVLRPRRGHYRLKRRVGPNK